ncbi:hypothetical protein FA13DRAFT_1713884 [Coprinellus micaceus]|uniref:Uncharacterized protein n=1 Tax=Coprinellus micaceus TaxID=71717 RepID=A0A4Y7SUV8_COPMI|nr:hypothetical protein FA13DRAFT_1713884 [Coprinellus micaceus]
MPKKRAAGPLIPLICAAKKNATILAWASQGGDPKEAREGISHSRMIWEQRKRGVTFREMGWVVHHGRGQCEEYDKEEEREMSTVGNEWSDPLAQRFDLSARAWAFKFNFEVSRHLAADLWWRGYTQDHDALLASAGVPHASYCRSPLTSPSQVPPGLPLPRRFLHPSYASTSLLTRLTAMPEWRECFAHLVMICKILDELRRMNNFHLLDIYAELSAKEIKPPGYGGSGSGTVARVTSAWGGVMKGKGDGQSTLAPPQLLALAEHPSGVSHRAQSLNWELKHITGNGRSLILVFDKCILKFSYLTHTSPQFLTTDMWFRSVMPTTGKQRGYKVALVFHFGNVLAFLSNDLIFKVKWIPYDGHDSITSLNVVDVFEDFHGFLVALVDWLKARRRSQAPRTGLACEVMRNEEGARKVWVGVGVYTVCELFFIAGISIFLSEKEVFDNASRTARLANAFWQFTYRAQDLYITCISRCMVGNVLAPTRAQRGLYSRYLYVFKKERTRLPPRMAKAVNDFSERLAFLARDKCNWWRRNDVTNKLCDFFEPSLMPNALLLRTCHPKVDVGTNERTRRAQHECRTCERIPCDMARKAYTLGSLSLGDKEWKKNAPQAIQDLEKQDGPDPLTISFDAELHAGMITFEDRHHTFLPEYPEGLIPEDVPLQERPYRAPFHYRLSGDAVYSIVEDFPENSTPDMEHQWKGISKRQGGEAILVDPVKAHSTAFVSVIKTDGLVAIGPLEYCGNGVPFTHAGKTYVSLVKDGDPRLPRHLLVRSAMRRMATKTIRHVQQARLRKLKQAAHIKALIAQGTKPKARVISITQERLKSQLAVKKELDAKVLVARKLKKNFRASLKQHNLNYAPKVSGPSEYSLCAAIPDIPSPTLSCSSSLDLEDDFDFAMYSPPASPPYYSATLLKEEPPAPIVPVQPNQPAASSSVKRRMHPDRAMALGLLRP